MKTIKRAMSIILVALMVFSCCGNVFASAADSYDHLPQVYVTGFQSANIYYENDPEKKPLFAPIDTDRILGNLWNIGSYVSDSIKNLEPNLLYSCVYGFLWDSFGMLAINPDGSNSEGVTVEPTVLTYTGDGRYEFLYDSRFNPIDIVPQLREYIELVKEDSGSDKVELVGSSYGADVVTTYLSVYKDDLDDIDSILLCVPSVGGIEFFGELLSGEFNIDPKGLENFVNDSLKMESVGTFLGLLNMTGVLEVLMEAMLEPVLREAIYRAVLDIGRDLIATIPAIWVCLQDEYFEPALKTMFGDDYLNPDHEYADLIADAIYYHENIMVNADDIITETKNSGKDVNVICKYGKPPIPLSKNAYHMEDGLATLEISSFGATCANYGELLPADYTQAKYPEYNMMSVTGDIDASTCLLPFDTWFIKGLEHSQKNEDYWKLVDAIVYEDLNVFTSEQHPQFLEVSAEDAERLVPLSEPEAEKGFFQKIIDTIVSFFENIINKIKGLFAYGDGSRT